MATNLAIDDLLLQEAQLVGKKKAKKAVVNEALSEYIQRRRQAEIIELFGTVEYDETYDHKPFRN